MTFEKLVNSFESEDTDESITLIQEFVYRHFQSTALPDSVDDRVRQRLWSGLFVLLQSDESSETVKLLCLTALKIVIRDKTDLASLASEARIASLVKAANLSKSCDEFPEFPSSSNQSRVVEALKCLYNLILNHNPVAGAVHKRGAIDALVRRTQDYNDPEGHEVTTFDLKLLFLLTLFCEEARFSFYRVSGGLPYLHRLLSSHLKNLKTLKVSAEERLRQRRLLSDHLKIWFNVLLVLNSEDPEVKCSPDELKDVVVTLREYLVADIHESNVQLKRDIINLLTLIPVEYLGIITSADGGGGPKSAKESGLLAVSRIIDYLEGVLLDFEEGHNASSNSRELLPPVLLVLLRLAQSNSVVRRHIRRRVLPKLTEAEVFTRPEEGATLRNKLCRLLTSPITNITDVTADFLFVLCKESVGRMVKYTGYGNAAGLFARRGLISTPLDYSSDSEGSDNEEYEKHREFIDPIVGCRTPSHPNPLEGMTEEQKEVLALELVNQVDRLMRDKIIQPCMIGPNGAPRPIDHIQQLQKSSQFIPNDDSDDD